MTQRLAYAFAIETLLFAPSALATCEAGYGLQERKNIKVYYVE